MLTASDVPTAIGQNKYSTPTELMMRKLGHLTFNGNAATFHGNEMEDSVRDMYCEKTGEVAHEIGLSRHPTIEWLGGSPDGITESGRLLEIKCPLSRDIGDGTIPKHYIGQVQVLMDVLDLEVCDFVQYKSAELSFPKPETFTIYTLKRDRVWMDEQLPIMKKWWDDFKYYSMPEHRQELLDKYEQEKKPKRPRKKPTSEIVTTKKKICTITDDF